MNEESFIPSEFDNIITRNEEIEDAKEEFTIYEEVKNIIENEKKKQYGDKNITFGRIANFWNTYLHNIDKLKKDLTRKDVAMLMILFKIAREQWSHRHDNLVDIIGYTVLADGMEKDG